MLRKESLLQESEKPECVLTHPETPRPRMRPPYFALACGAFAVLCITMAAMTLESNLQAALEETGELCLQGTSVGGRVILFSNPALPVLWNPSWTAVGKRTFRSTERSELCPNSVARPRHSSVLVRHSASFWGSWTETTIHGDEAACVQHFTDAWAGRCP